MIVLTEIGARNIGTVEHLLPNYDFYYTLPREIFYGGVGTYVSKSIGSIQTIDDLNFTKTCQCSKCAVETLYIRFDYGERSYILGGMYWHPNGNIKHFIEDLENTKIDNKCTAIFVGDINIDLIKYENSDNSLYMSTLMSYGYLPFVTLPTRITDFSATCIDHNNSHRHEEVACGIFYCDITDHLPCFVTLKRQSINVQLAISLLSCFNKIFEKILCKQLLSFIDRFVILYSYQFGFRQLYSTTLALIEFSDTVHRLLDEKNYVIGIFADFTKAFDTVDHDILLSKLDRYGIRGHDNNFFRSYLTNREQYTFVNGAKSDTKRIQFGVPQGSVLGPLFFLLYINDIYRAVDDTIIRLFADDTSLLIYDQNLNISKNKASHAFQGLFDWCKVN